MPMRGCVLRYGSIGAVVLIGTVALLTPSTVTAQPPVLPIPDYKCEIVHPVEGGPPIIDCGDAPIGPIAHPPVLVGPMYANGDEFTIALVDERNPRGATYKVTLYGPDDQRAVSDWSTERCRRFNALRHDSWYRFEVVARNPLSGYETEPESYHWWSWSPRPNSTPPDDPWLAKRIDEVANLYHLTEAAHDMMAAVPVKVYRNEPGHAGYGGPIHGVGIGLATHPWTLSHEMMHAFWIHWDGFPAPCDQMNIWTFRRDLTRFALEFILHDRYSSQPNPMEPWRPYFNSITAEFRWWRNPWGLVWETYKTGDFFGADIWHMMYHVPDTDPPMIVLGKFNLLPPTLRSYFDGYIRPRADSTTATWEPALDHYTALAAEDRRLMDEASRYYNRLLINYYLNPPETRTSLSEPFRTYIRDADRQALVDFINTLEDMACNQNCEAWWDADPPFWAHYSLTNLIRWTRYQDEIGPATGIELPASNWRAVKRAMEPLPVCNEDEAASARQHINGQGGLSSIQRQAILEVLTVSEELLWICHEWGDVEGYARGVEDGGLEALRQGPTLSRHCTELRPEPPPDSSPPPCALR